MFKTGIIQIIVNYQHMLSIKKKNLHRQLIHKTMQKTCQKITNSQYESTETI